VALGSKTILLGSEAAIYSAEIAANAKPIGIENF
jgi:hypothetical protein